MEPTRSVRTVPVPSVAADRPRPRPDSRRTRARPPPRANACPWEAAYAPATRHHGVRPVPGPDDAPIPSAPHDGADRCGWVPCGGSMCTHPPVVPTGRGPPPGAPPEGPGRTFHRRRAGDRDLFRTTSYCEEHQFLHHMFHMLHNSPGMETDTLVGAVAVVRPSRPRGTFLDLFAGCGGLALGFKQAGFVPLGAVEIDPDAAATYALNIDRRIVVDDISRVREWPRVDVVVGGPPCQGFSQLGSRDPDDPRNRLWREYLRALDATGADRFVMENVPQLLRSDQFAMFRGEVERRGFRVAAEVLCAADFGVPQVRRRAIVIGSRSGEVAMPSPTHGQDSPHRRPWVTVREALGAPPALPEHPDGRNWHVDRPSIRDDSRARYRAVPQDGGNRFQMQASLDARGLGGLVPGCWRRKTTGTTDVFGRLWWDRPALTVRTEFFKPEKGRYLHPTADRPITVREAARLQSFPDDFRFPEGQRMVSVARQVGNAVPPRFALAVARTVAESMTPGRPDAVRRRQAEPVRQLELAI